MSLEPGREQWASRLGFILAAMGSAVGLGNVWRFSYVTGENGGAAFLLIYVAFIILIGIPIIMAEFTIGRKAQSDAVGSFEKLAPGKPWKVAGLMGVGAAFLILSFYGVIAGWISYYFVNYLTGSLWSAPAEGYESFFVSFITNPVQPLLWQFIFMALTIGIVFVGVKKGIERSNKILMPLLGVLLIVLSIYSLTLGGAQEGLAFLFTPDWNALKDPNIYLAALGQAFFSLSLGMGALITYGSYLSNKERLPGAAASVATLDTLFAIVAGLMIFPAVFALGMDPAGGPGLVFMVMPDVFDSIGFGGIFGLLFFFLLAAAALSSAVSLLEVAVAYFIRKFSWSRKKASLIIGSLIFALGIPSSLGQGVLSNVRIIGGRDILDSIDFIASNIFLPLGGLIIALFMGWGWKKADALRDSDFGDTVLGNIWLFLIRWIAPIFIFAVFLSSIGLF
ncbi:sodium-dependent transporter [Halalkalibacter akibai JCM 9157]|uniref:Sodium-dependent transporter n=1 Tax=Halalkalibacter akibai (strain ATCC 43226 / DSM 21942 / CIP 109018 / JCM 9157 / 1139) TaxID=1236973 RepID=W4QU83_HALA3|nr:sodium-dependent transporter [Halalkalibacter akibai]GAE35641.1 sodium-dependent transporter [Halalkalibacter akibai JCM 9157]